MSLKTELINHGYAIWIFSFSFFLLQARKIIIKNKQKKYTYIKNKEKDNVKRKILFCGGKQTFFKIWYTKKVYRRKINCFTDITFFHFPCFKNRSEEKQPPSQLLKVFFTKYNFKFKPFHFDRFWVNQIPTWLSQRIHFKIFNERSIFFVDQSFYRIFSFLVLSKRFFARRQKLTLCLLPTWAKYVHSLLTSFLSMLLKPV